MSEFFSGFFGVIIASYIAWYTWLKGSRGQMERDLLNEALDIQAATEAWYLEPSQENVSRISAHKKPIPIDEHDENLSWLRKVEIRAVLDDSTWNYPTKSLPCYDFIEGRRAWIIRDEIKDESKSYPALPGQKVLSKPALISSKGIEELCGWVEKVASARQGCKWFNQMLTDDGLKMIAPLLEALSGPDRIKAFDERLSERARLFLRQYRESKERRYRKCSG